MKANKIVRIGFALLGIALLASCEETVDNVLHPIVEISSHHIDGTLHDVKVTPRETVKFVEDGVSPYAIVYDDSNKKASEAAQYLKSGFVSALSVNVALTPYTEGLENSYTKDSQYIVLNIPAIEAKTDFVRADANDLQFGGYQIETFDKSLIVAVNSVDAYQHAILGILKHILGYERISERITFFHNVPTDYSTSKTFYLPEVKILERPDFQIRTQSNKVSSSYSYMTGFLNSGEVFYSGDGILVFHNSFNWINPTKCLKDHPSWYATTGNQLCYCARGDETEYNLMVNYAYEQVMERLNDSLFSTYTFTIEDNHDACACPACVEAHDYYGSYAGVVVKFLNDLDDKVQAELQRQADVNHTTKRLVNSLFFAYHKTEMPPLNTNPDGSFKIKCNDTVCPYIALISANYTEDFYSDANSEARASLNGWSKLAKNLYLWLYETNFSEYLLPLNSYSSMIETYRFCADVGCLYMYNEGQHNNNATTAFGRFKEYLNQVSLFDVNTDYNWIVDNFFTKYFGPAKEAMLKLFYEIQERMYYLNQAYPQDVTGNIYDKVNQGRFWPKKLLDHYLDYIDEAYAAIDYLGQPGGDYSLYDTYRLNIELESIFPRYVLLTNHSGKYSSDALQVERIAFKNACTEVEITCFSEGGNIKDLWSQWGIA